MSKSLNIIAFFVGLIFFSMPIYAQDAVVVQPGAPGKVTKVLPSDTNAKLPSVTKADVEFMQGMIHHHAQAVEMVALMADRTNNEELLRFGERISQTQADEIRFMERWLTNRWQNTSMDMSAMNMKKMPDEKMSEHKDHKMDKMEKMDKSLDHKDHEMDKMKMSDHIDHQMMMPGMLTPKQMKELANSKGAEFDRLFLTGMIQHHEGALVMVDELFKSKGAGQDVEIFTFATDVDGSQRAEIRIMQTMLREKP